MSKLARLRSLTAGMSATVCVFLWPILALAEEDEAQDRFAELEFRYIGPIGNRAPAVTGVAGDPNTFYAGAASGGIFKTSDGGATWKPIFDDTPASSIGSLAVSLSDPNVVWAGTGETFIRANISIGDGIYRSTDAGRTWRNMGLGQTGRIGRVVIHPQNPEIVYAAALGHVYGPQSERGVYRTLDGGETWEKVLFVDEDTGAIDIVMDPNNPRILFAAMWQIHVWTAGRTSGGPGSGLYMSRDGGDTWTSLEDDGLPEKPWGKIGLTMSADDSDRIYALIEISSNREFAPVDDSQGVLWRSDDGGEKWSLISSDNTLAQRPLYYTRAQASPDNANEITFMAVQQSISRDGGVSIERQNSGWDHHDIWIDPVDPDRRITGHDGGVSITVNRGRTWLRPQLPIAQVYHVATDTRIPYNVYGNRQDGPTAMGPSNTLSGSTIPVGAWQEVGGCEVGFTLPDPEDPNTVWAGCYDGILELYDHRSRQSRNVSVWPQAIESWPTEDLKYRVQWTAPLAISPHDHETVYYGSQFVHRTRNQGRTWEVISPDLTTADPELMRRTGGLTLDDAGPTNAPVVFAIAESRLEPGVIWAGTNDGQVQVTRDDGENWTNVTAGLGVPTLGTISNIEPSRHAEGAAYLTVDRHQEGDTATYVYRTSDYGATWNSLRGDLPQSVFSYAHCVREDPKRPGMLYLGTENELWVSVNDGENWRPLGAGLPPAPVHWIEVQEHFDDLVVATYGRGFWILDDLAGVRGYDRAVEAGEAHLFDLRDTYRFRGREGAWSEYQNAAAGENPEAGASVHYYLPQKVEGSVSLVIRDHSGEVVKELEDLDSGEGLHRTHWNLYQEKTPEVKLRTKPEEASHVRIPERGWRRQSDGGRFSIYSPPGEYTLELVIDDEVVGSSLLRVLKDPASPGSEIEIAEQMVVLNDLHDLLTISAEMINASEWSRKQLHDLRVAWKALREADDEEGAEKAVEASGEEEETAEASEDTESPEDEEPQDFLAAIEEVDGKLKELESLYFDLRLTGASQDSLRWKRLLSAQLTRLARGIAAADVRPTDAQMEFYAEVKQQVEAAQEAWTQVREEAIPALNALAREQGVEAVILAQPK